ncbi:hypothetical protein ACKI1I_42505 [Streptomyces turgidiscabies]|uniref:hypothetical protein n=1 Tax=Streptomyces turgidiscabies TaxID=85558 RepID=UPI0038F5EC24
MEENPEVRRAAWDSTWRFTALQKVRPSGQVLTSVQDGALGDVDDVRGQLARHQELLIRRCPDLVQQVHDIVVSWEDHPADRLVRLIPLLDAVAAIAGSSLPPQVPPTR